jgi:hypothetical protein
MSDAFRLSRIFAEGWKTANTLSSSDRDGLKARSVSARNPYASEPERSRWSEGFTKALGILLPPAEDLR